MTDETIGVREAARIAGVHENTIRNWAKAGILDSALVLANEQRPRRYRRFSRDAVEQLAQMKMPTSPPADHVEAFRRGYEMGWRDGVMAARRAISEVPINPNNGN